MKRTLTLVLALTCWACSSPATLGGAVAADADAAAGPGDATAETTAVDSAEADTVGAPTDAATDANAADATTDARASDVPATDAMDGAAGDTGGVICGCDAASCGTRTCGRSACGFPCGTCGDNEWCAKGTCMPGGGPGSPCVGAFAVGAFAVYGGDLVWEGDVGLRACPGDPTKVETCTCSGGGKDAWIACSGGCFVPCAGDVGCGAAKCGALDYCQVCGPAGGTAATASCQPRAGAKSACPTKTDLLFAAFCDGHDDCGAGGKCTAVRGDIVRLSCEPAAKSAECGLFQQTCQKSADCPACAKSCAASLFADQTTPTGYGVAVCQ